MGDSRCEQDTNTAEYLISVTMVWRPSQKEASGRGPDRSKKTIINVREETITTVQRVSM